MVLDLNWSMGGTKRFLKLGSFRLMTMWKSARTQRLIGPASVEPGSSKESKIDNLVQIAHNVIVGKNSIIAAQTGISGSTRVGENVKMAGQVGVIGHLTIEDDTVIAAQSGISKDLPGGAWFGSPAVPLSEAKRQIALIHRLRKLVDRIKAIEKKLGL